MVARVLGINVRSLTRAEGLALAAGLAALLAALWISVGDLTATGGIDLRARVVGARALVAGLDPYVAGPTLPGPELLDPRGRYPGPSRATYPPTLLALYALPAGLPYATQRLLWGGLEWAALLATLVILAGGLPPRQRAWGLAGGLVVFAASHFWRLHVERGQYYVFVALLLAIECRQLPSPRPGRVAGLALGLAAALRPSLAVLIPLLAVAGWRPAAWRATLVAGLAVAAVTMATGPGAWLGYMGNVADWTALLSDPGAFQSRYGPIQAIPPAVAEGIDFSRELPAETANVTLAGLAGALELGWAGLADPIAKGLAALWLAAALWWCRRLGRCGADPRRRLLACLAAALAVDFLLPIRHGYADVLMLPPLALALPLAWAMPSRNRLAVLAVQPLLLALPLFDGGAATLLRSPGLWAVTAAVAVWGRGAPRISGV